MRSSSLKDYIESGMFDTKTPNGTESKARIYRDYLVHDWYLPEWVKGSLEKHFLEIKDSTEIFQLCSRGQITNSGKTYEVIWIHSPQRLENKKMLLSYRYCRYLNCGYVLIKEYQEDNKQS